MAESPTAEVLSGEGEVGRINPGQFGMCELPGVLADWCDVADTMNSVAEVAAIPDMFLQKQTMVLFSFRINIRICCRINFRPYEDLDEVIAIFSVRLLVL